MASYTVVRAKHQTLAAAVVDTITFTGGWQFVEVSNWGSGRINFTADGSTPTVNGDDSLPVGPGGSYLTSVTALQQVKLISLGITEYSVVGS